MGKILCSMLFFNAALVVALPVAVLGGTFTKQVASARYRKRIHMKAVGLKYLQHLERQIEALPGEVRPQTRWCCCSNTVVLL